MAADHNIFFAIPSCTLHLISLSQIGQFTLDNAANCNTLMEWLEFYLTEEGIVFDKVGNRIRYIFY